MLSAGLDFHKRYSQVEVLDEDGLSEVQLAHPYRVRAIAAAQVKTDSIDARTLGQLLRAGLIPRAYIPGQETRQFREVVRQRLFLVRLQTMIKNRIHALLDRYHVALPAVSDLFGKGGRAYLSQVRLPGPAEELLSQDLRLYENIHTEVRETQKQLRKELEGDRRVELLLTIPGLGQILATVVALEIDQISRFASSSKLVAYAGLVPSTYSSGGKTSHGGLMKQSNKWLRGLWSRRRGLPSDATPTSVTTMARAAATKDPRPRSSRSHAGWPR